MIGLDRNPHIPSPSNPAAILHSSHPDQFWSSLQRDATRSNHNSPAIAPATISSHVNSSPQGGASKDAPSSPPNRHSSLTPAPESSPPRPDRDPDANPSGDAPRTDTSGGKSTDSAAAATEDADTGAPSPLSELSPAPDDDEDDDDEPEEPKEEPKKKVQEADKGEGPSTRARTKAANAAKSTPRVNGVNKKRNEPPNSQPSASTSRHSQSLSHPPSAPDLSRTTSHQRSLSSSKAPPPGQNPKVMAILELNAELFKLCMDIQSTASPSPDPRYPEYAARLQGNIHWCAALADNRTAMHRVAIPPPTLSCPPPIDHPSFARIQQLYAELPHIFAKDIARVQALQQASAPIPQSGTPVLQNMSLKRDRSEDVFDSMNKRRDTGERKGPMPPPGTPINPGLPPNFSKPGLPALATPQMQHSPAIPSQPFNPQFNANTPDAQVQRARQVQMRQQALQQHQQLQQAQMAQAQQAGRQMSPSQTLPGQMLGGGMQGMGNVGAMAGGHIGGGEARGVPMQEQAQVTALLQQYGNTGMQFLQMLSDPNHSFLRMMQQQVPNFMSLPLVQQLPLMHQVHKHLQTRLIMQQQGRLNMQQNGGMLGTQGGMVGGMSAPQLAGMVGGSGAGMTQKSPVGQQISSSSHSPTSNMSFGGGGGGGLGGSNNLPGGMRGDVDPRTGNPMMTPQHMSQLSHSQRQQMLLLQHQQMQMRNGMGNAGGSNPSQGINPQAFGGGINPQQLIAHQQQQRLQQQQQQHSGSPMHAGSPVGDVSGGGNVGFGGMQGVGMSGIGRNTHSPSESAPSPMTPRVGHQNDFRAMAMQAAQGLNARSPSRQGGGGFINPQQMMGGGGGGAGAGWQQDSQGMQMGGGVGGGNSFGVSPPGSAHGHSFSGSSAGVAAAPSPGGGGGGGSMQGWQSGGGNFSFDQSFGMDSVATPGGSGGLSQTSPVEGMEFGDFFNWS